MSNFQDELRRLEQASDQARCQEAEQQALAAQNQAEQISAARGLRAIIDSCISEATRAVPSMRTEHTATDLPVQEWVLHWKDGERSLKIQLLQDRGVVWWTWFGHGRTSSIAKRSARDADQALIENLIAALANPAPWQRGGYPPEPTW
jgi:hypothetical protein